MNIQLNREELDLLIEALQRRQNELRTGFDEVAALHKRFMELREEYAFLSPEALQEPPDDVKESARIDPDDDYSTDEEYQNEMDLPI